MAPATQVGTPVSVIHTRRPASPCAAISDRADTGVCAICVHAEQNALITAARFGNAVEDAMVYSTLRPCFDCTKAMLQAKVRSIRYLHDWQHPIGELREQYQLLQDMLPGGVQQVAMEDPEADWANARPPA